MMTSLSPRSGGRASEPIGSRGRGAEGISTDPLWSPLVRGTKKFLNLFYDDNYLPVIPMTDDIFISASLTIPMRELSFSTSRSGGPGGQHVNKTETRVELTFDVLNAHSLSPAQRVKILRGLTNRIDTEGLLHITASEERSQFQNKHIAVERFRELLAAVLRPRKRRIATKPSGSAREKRIQSKKIVSKKKTLRRKSIED